MDYELGPTSLAVQKHMGSPKVFEDSQRSDHWLPRQDLSYMDHTNGPDLCTRADQVGSTPGRPRVENLVAWECPGGALASMDVQRRL